MMSRLTLWTFVVASCALGIAGCGSGSGLRVAITAAPTTLAAGTTNIVIATVTHDSTGGGVNWSCMPAGSCGTFNPTQTGNGLPSAYTAPPAAPSGGSVTIIATSVADPSRSDSVTVAITGVLTQNFVFYASGEENVSPNFPIYSIAGVVSIAQVASADGSFAVVSGEQDYNDGVAITSPQPSGDSITGGSLALAANGVGTLTVITNNSQLGNAGTEMIEKRGARFLQPDGSIMVESRMNVDHVGDAILYMASLPLDANVQFMTVMATKMPYIGRA